MKKNFLNRTYELKTEEQTFLHYEEWAETYDADLFDNQYAQPRRSVEALCTYLKETDIRVLDVGCGTGLSGKALRGSGFKEIDGCDFSPSMLKKAEITNAYRNLFEADLNKGLDIPDNSYDAISAVGVLAHAHIDSDAIHEMLRVLKSGGLLVIALNEHYWEGGLLPEKLEEISKEGLAEVLMKEYGEHMPGVDVGGWVAVLRKA